MSTETPKKDDKQKVVTKEQLEAIAKILGVNPDQIITSAEQLSEKLTDFLEQRKDAELGEKLKQEFLIPNNIGSHDFVHAFCYILGTNLKNNTKPEEIKEMAENMAPEIEYWFKFKLFVEKNDPSSVTTHMLNQSEQAISELNEYKKINPETKVVTSEPTKDDSPYR